MTDEELLNRLAALESGLKDHVSAECERIETKLLKAFHGWARTMEIRVRQTGLYDERLAVLEERVSEIERGKDAA